MQLSDKDWKKKLTPQQYAVLRQKDTEAPFSGKLLHNKDNGMYACAACGAELFHSETKFDSGSGWLSFYDIENREGVKMVEDNEGGLKRVEVKCANCDSHLGHVFHDAPDQPTGLRFCINSCALDFHPTKDNHDKNEE